MHKLLRRAVPLLLLLGLTGAASAASDAPAQLRIGYQKGAVGMALAKSHRLLEQRYPDTRIRWVEFPAGPQLLEALNVGSIDLGGTGDIPPIFAQAAGSDLLYVGAEPAKPRAEVILVADNSPIKTVADLKGRRVALQKGSSSHNLLLRALQKAGLRFSDIQPVWLTPADARAAFQQGNVDAWAIWDPYYSAATLHGGARVLTDGEGLNLTGSFYLASRSWANQHGPFLRQVLDTFSQADNLVRSQRQQSIGLLSTATGLPQAVIARYLSNRPVMTIRPVDEATAARQQKTADLFYANRLIPKPVDIHDRIWRPTAAQGEK